MSTRSARQQRRSRIKDARFGSSFSYAPDKHRYKQVSTDGVTPTTTLYVGGVEIITSGGVTHYHHTISAYGRPVMLDDLSSNSSSNPVETKSYLLTDHLGNVMTTVADTDGSAGEQDFDSFGRHRDPATWQVSSGNATTLTKHGFTGHEHLDNLGLVHANGRVYDPALGRFLSVDPIFQAPTNTQSVNAYSYVMNNPLSLTDPSGYETNVACNTGSSKSTVSCDKSYTSMKPGETIHGRVTTTNLDSRISKHAEADITATGPGDGPKSGGNNPGTSPDYKGVAPNGVQRNNQVAGTATGDAGKPAENKGGPAKTTSAAATGNQATSDSSTTATSVAASTTATLPTTGSVVGGGGIIETIAGIASTALTAATVVASSLTLSGDTDQRKYVNHYTTDLNHMRINVSGEIIPNAQGKVYVTPGIYLTGDSARKALQLDKTPNGYYRIPYENILPATTPPHQVPNGTGIEIILNHSVSIEGATWIEIPPK